jgi:hypothetical protein
MLGKRGIDNLGVFFRYRVLASCDCRDVVVTPKSARVSIEVLEAPVESKYIAKSLLASLTNLFRIPHRK